MTILLAIALMCPTAPQVAGLEVFELVEGCAQPIRRGWVITPDAFSRNTARIKGLDAKLATRNARLDECRVKRDEIRSALIESSKSNSALIKRLAAPLIEAPPSRVVWAGIGAAATVVAVVSGAYLYAEMRDN